VIVIWVLTKESLYLHYFFIFFVNDMSPYFQTDSLDDLSIDELQIYILLFADDTVLFSYTKPGLQILFNKLQ